MNKQYLTPPTIALSLEAIASGGQSGHPRACAKMFSQVGVQVKAGLFCAERRAQRSH